MTRLALALLLVLPVAAVQDKTPDEEAKEAMAAYKEKRKKGGESDLIDAISILREAKPHKVIRTELSMLLEGRFPNTVREAAAEALGKYKKDLVACEVLVRRAKEERGKEASDLRKRCLRSFGDIAPFGKAMDLQNFPTDPDTGVCRASIEALEKINSVRSLRILVALLGELESIREDEGGGPGVPGGAGAGDKDAKKKRKDELLDPTRGAVRTIFEKVDSKRKVDKYIDANRALNELRVKIKEKQDEEDLADKKP